MAYLGTLTWGLTADIGAFAEGFKKAGKIAKDAVRGIPEQIKPEIDKTTKELARAEKSFKGLQTTMKGMQAKDIAPSDDFIKTYDTAAKKAETLRVRLEALQAVQQRDKQFNDKLLNTAAGQRALGIEQNAANAAKAAVGLGGYAKAAEKAGISAGQLAAANRMLPAQFTDIAVSLQGGQAPLTVLLQQGGQIKDMYGGVGAALKGVAGYAISLINPFTVAAAAVGGLAAAWLSAQKEGEQFNETAIAIGNYGGITKDSLQGMANSLQQLNGVNVSGVADALNSIASTGKFTASQLEEVARAALEWQQATGTAVQDTVAEFVKLQGDPVNAILELNDKYHLLTESVYEQIKSLDEQGNHQEAVRVGIDAVAATMDQRAAEMVASANKVTKAWMAMKSVFIGAWNAIKTATNEQLGGDSGLPFGELQQRIKGLQSQVATGPGLTESQARQNDRARSQLVQLQEEYQRRSRESLGRRFNTETVEPSWLIKQNEANQKLRDQLLAQGDKTIAQEQALAKARKDAQKAGLNESQTEKLLASVRERYADRPTGGHAGGRRSGGGRVSHPRAGKSDAQKELEQRKKAYDAIADAQDKVAEKYLKDQEASEAFARGLKKSNSDLQKGFEIDQIGTGLSSRERERLQKNTQVRWDFQKKLDDREAEHNKKTRHGEDDPFYEEDKKALQKSLDEQLDIWDKHWKDVDLKRSNALAGAQQAVADYQDKTTDTFEQVRAAVASATSGMETAVAANLDGIVRGTESMSEAVKNTLKSLGDAIIKIFVDLAAQRIVGSIFAPILGGAGSVAGGLLGSGGAVAAAAGGAGAAGLGDLLFGGGFQPWAPVPDVGIAHSGIDRVPETGTWLLKRGERVTTEQTSSKLDRTLERVNSSMRPANDGAFAPTVNLTVNGDPDKSTIARINEGVQRAVVQAHRQVTQDVASGKGRVSGALRNQWGSKRRVR